MKNLTGTIKPKQQLTPTKEIILNGAIDTERKESYTIITTNNRISTISAISKYKKISVKKIFENIIDAYIMEEMQNEEEAAFINKYVDFMEELKRR